MNGHTTLRPRGSAQRALPGHSWHIRATFRGPQRAMEYEDPNTEGVASTSNPDPIPNRQHHEEQLPPHLSPFPLIRSGLIISKS